MKCLEDNEYENYDYWDDPQGNLDHRKMIPKEEIDCLAPYNHVFNGFLTWECGKCGMTHGGRMWKMSGIVVRCGTRKAVWGGGEKPEKHVFEDGCGAWNLLVRTDCTEINESLRTKWELHEAMGENKRMVGIAELNDEKVGKIVRQLVTASDTAIHNLASKLRWDLRYPPQEVANEGSKDESAKEQV